MSDRRIKDLGPGRGIHVTLDARKKGDDVCEAVHPTPSYPLMELAGDIQIKSGRILNEVRRMESCLFSTGDTDPRNGSEPSCLEEMLQMTNSILVEVEDRLERMESRLRG